MKPIDVLAQETLTVLREHGWLRGGSFNSTGNMCLGSALNYAAQEEHPRIIGRWRDEEMQPVYAAVAAVVRDLYPDRFAYARRYGAKHYDRDTMVCFNDHNETTLKDVRRVLLEVIRAGKISEREEEEWERQFEPLEVPRDPGVPDAEPVHVPDTPVVVPV